MKAFDGLNSEIIELIRTLDDKEITNIQNYLSDETLSKKYISVLKSECNKMEPLEAISYLFRTTKKQVFIIEKVKGIKGLATLLNVSLKTAQKLKNSGIIDGAIIYEKSKLYFAEEEVLKICLPKILFWKSFKLRKDVDQESIDLWENFILSKNMKKP